MGSEMCIRDSLYAIDLEPENATAYTNRGYFFWDQNQPKDAILDLNEAISINPELAIAYINRALVHCSMGNEAECEADIEKAGELGRDREELRNSIEELIADP